MKKILWILLLLSNMLCALGQNGINRTDSNGLKQGRWINKTKTSLIECCYLDNLLHGVYVSYSAVSGKLYSIGEYNNGEYSGTWYFFDDNGLPLSKVDNIQRNDSIVIDSKKISLNGGKPVFTATLVFFFPSGMVKSIGMILYSGSFEEDYLEYGEWLYYDEKGNLMGNEKK